jgi:hypothetical protein
MLGLLRTLGLPQRRDSDGDTIAVLIDLSRSDLPAGRRERARAHLAGAGSVPPSG